LFAAVHKAKLTATSYVVLGLVEQMQPATAYDLKRAAAESVANFWSLPHSQLYAECARLATAGLLSERREEGGRRRRIYRLARAGSEALEHWRSQPTDELYELRDAGLLKLYFGAEPAELAARQAEAHKRKLAEYEAQLEECRELGPGSPIVLAIKAGVGHEREYVRFWSQVGGD
jgi:PadR family transcriptional regulator AphA